jgi:hypothetical protein
VLTVLADMCCVAQGFSFPVDVWKIICSVDSNVISVRPLPSLWRKWKEVDGWKKELSLTWMKAIPPLTYMLVGKTRKIYVESLALCGPGHHFSVVILYSSDEQLAARRRYICDPRDFSNTLNLRSPIRMKNDILVILSTSDAQLNVVNILNL